MERSDDVLVEAFGAETAERVRRIERELVGRFAALGRVEPVGVVPELPPALVEVPFEPQPEESAATQSPVWRIPPDTSRTMLQIAEEKRRLYPEFCDAGPPRSSMMRKKY